MLDHTRPRDVTNSVGDSLPVTTSMYRVGANDRTRSRRALHNVRSWSFAGVRTESRPTSRSTSNRTVTRRQSPGYDCRRRTVLLASERTFPTPAVPVDIPSSLQVRRRTRRGDGLLDRPTRTDVLLVLRRSLTASYVTGYGKNRHGGVRVLGLDHHHRAFPLTLASAACTLYAWTSLRY